MKVLGVAGSLRGSSHNRRLLQAAASLLPPEVQSTEYAGLKLIRPFDEDDEAAPALAVVRWRQAIARAYSEAGADVVITGRDEERGRHVAESATASGGRVRFVRADLERIGDLRRLAEALGDVDVLVNNAGAFPFGATHAVGGAVFDSAVAVNIKAPFFLTGAFAPWMASNGGGAILNISTMVESFGLPGMALYGSTKAALELLTKAWTAQYGPQGVRVNAIAPGPTRTPGTAPMGEGLDQLALTLPLGRPANAGEIANAALFLGSDEAPYVNCVILAVDGGRTAI